MIRSRPKSSHSKVLKCWSLASDTLVEDLVMAKWFINVEQEVTGPHSTDEVKSLVSEGHIPPDALVWAKPHADWVKANWWLENHHRLLEKMKKKPLEQHWHFAHNGDTHGPMTRQNLIESLKSIKNLNEVLVWTKGMKSWMEVFEFHDLLEDLGCNRREHPRAPAVGTVIVKSNNTGAPILGQLASISQGGLGVKHVGNQLHMGDVVHLEIKCDALPSTVSASATVQYITDTGFAGLKFQQIHRESQNMIIDYVRGFVRQEAA